MLRLFFIMLCFSLTSLWLNAQTKSPKRGVGYGHHSVIDIQNAAPWLSWWYNWSSSPEAAISDNYHQHNIEFVPMAWNAAGINGVSQWVATDTAVKYILGFNEPNFTDQANMKPSQAAASWPLFENIALENNLKTVGPAVNYCGNCVSEGGTTYNNPFDYLDDFFEQCTDCQVDYIALHWYGGGASIQSFVNDARKYGKPIWVTEFAAWDNSVTKLSDQMNYLAGTVNFLERDPDVFRYAWFIGRTDGGIHSYPYIDLYAEDGALTELGQLYASIPAYNPDYHFPVPGRIEAEEYYRQEGLFGELTSDIDGFMNLGWTEANDFVEYKINVEQSGNYTLNARVAGTQTGVMAFYVDSVQVKRVKTPITGGWQTWQTVSETITLPQGEHILHMKVVSGGFNFNWFDLVSQTTGIIEREPLKAEVFPNPINDNLIHISLKNNIHGENITYRIINSTGAVLYSNVEKVQGSSFQINLNNVSHPIAPGVYILNIESKTERVSKMISILP